MEFFSYHGCGEEEKKTGNIFIVSLNMETEMEIAAKSDSLADTLDYQTAYNIVGREMGIPSNLLENVCHRILDALFEEFAELKTATVKVSKLNPNMGGKIGRTSVTMSR